MEGHNSHQILKEDIDTDNSLSSSELSISISLSREDILAICEEGPEAVIFHFRYFIVATKTFTRGIYKY